jgi:hypothetical protein
VVVALVGTVAVAVQVGYWQLQLLCHQVRHTQLPSVLVALGSQLELEIMVQILLFLQLQRLLAAAQVHKRLQE